MKIPSQNRVSLRAATLGLTLAIAACGGADGSGLTGGNNDSNRGGGSSSGGMAATGGLGGGGTSPAGANGGAGGSSGAGMGGASTGGGASSGGTGEGVATETCDVDILVVQETGTSIMDVVTDFTEHGIPEFMAALADYPKLGEVRIALTGHSYGEMELQPNPNDPKKYKVDAGAFHTRGWDPSEPHTLSRFGGLQCNDLPNVDCGFASGKTWIEGTSDTLTSSSQREFACIGNVPCQTYPLEHPLLEAAVKALEHPTAAGFLRDDALLMTLYITDHEDTSALRDWEVRRALLDFKAGDETRVAVATLAGPRIGTEVVNDFTGGKGCYGIYRGVEATPRIIGFTERFGERGVHYEFCEEADVATGLQRALDVLKRSCEQLAP